MLKVSGYIFILIFAIVYLISSSTELTEKLLNQRLGSNSFLRSDKYTYGDLFGMSYLPQYQIPQMQESSIPLLKCTTNSGMHLYTICDSYLFTHATDRKYYCGADSIFIAKINYSEKITVKLNLQKRNILLIELSERSIRPYLNANVNASNFINAGNYNKVETRTNIIKPTLLSKLIHFLFNKSINTNLEMNIWEFSVFTRIKELKAYINYKLFDVVDNNIVISPDKKYLLFKPTIDSSTNISSFHFMPDTEVRSIVGVLNGIYSSAKKMGFNEVYLAIIPNPVSILYPDYKGFKYNNLITRVQNSPDLKMHIVDIYSTFKNTKLQVYIRSDTHWNLDGLYIWLNKLNSMMYQPEK